MARIKEIGRKPSGRRKRKPVVYHLICEGSETEILSRESNPVTTVVELVEYLNSKQ